MASIPFLIGAQRKLHEAVPVQPAATPTAPLAPAAPVAPTTSPEQQTQPSGVDWNAFKSKLTALISQPQTDSQAVMQLIADMLAQAPVGSSDRQQMVNLIKAFQTNQTMVAKVPQLQQISLESRTRSGKILQEKKKRRRRKKAKTPAAPAAAQTELKRSELDKIFVQIAQFLAHQRIINQDAFPQQSPPQQIQRGQQPNQQGQTQGQPDINTYAGKSITHNAIQQAMRNNNLRPGDEQKWIDPIKKKLADMVQRAGNSPIQFGTLLQQFDRDQQHPAMRSNNMPSQVQDVLINAASRGQ